MRKIGLLLGLFLALGAAAAEAAPQQEYAGIIKHRANIEREFKSFEAVSKTPVQAIIFTDEANKTVALKVGKVDIVGNKRLPSSFIENRFKLQAGEIVNLAKLKQKINIYNASNISKIQAIIASNTDKASYDITFKVVEPKHKHNDSLFVTNTGLRATGELKLGYNGSTYGFLRNDDLLKTYRSWSRGELSNANIYDMPLLHCGTRIYGGVARDRIRPRQGMAKNNYKATANEIWGGIKHPLLATETLKVEAFGELHHKWDLTDFNSCQWRDSKTELASLGLYLRSLGEKSITCVKLTGNIYRDNKKAKGVTDNDNNGSYWQGFLWHKQELGNKQTLLVKAYGQYTSKRYLPSTETMSIGGEYSIRGFEEALLEGSKGVFGTLEYGFPLSRKSLRGSLFYDCGLVYDNRELGLGRNSLTSCGIGLEYQKKGWTGKVTLGIPLSSPKLEHRSKTRTHIFLQKNI